MKQKASELREKYLKKVFLFFFFVNFSHGSLLEHWVCYVRIHLELVALFLCKQVVLGLVPSVILIQNVLALFCPPQKKLIVEPLLGMLHFQSPREM